MSGVLGTPALSRTAGTGFRDPSVSVSALRRGLGVSRRWGYGLIQPVRALRRGLGGFPVSLWPFGVGLRVFQGAIEVSLFLFGLSGGNLGVCLSEKRLGFLHVCLGPQMGLRAPSVSISLSLGMGRAPPMNSGPGRARLGVPLMPFGPLGSVRGSLRSVQALTGSPTLVPHSALCWGPLFSQLCGKGGVGAVGGSLLVPSDPWERKEQGSQNSLGWRTLMVFSFQPPAAGRDTFHRPVLVLLGTAFIFMRVF